MDTTEHADLENLLKSPGWLRVLERAREEWKDGYPAKIKLAIQEARDKGEDVASAVVKVDYASDEINRLLSWPKERLAQMTRASAEVTNTAVFSRGGYDITPAR